MLACVGLHNYLHLTDNAYYSPAGFINSEDNQGVARMRELLDAFKPKGEGTAMKLMQFARHLCSISLHPKARFHGNGIMYRAAALRETLNT